MDYWEVTADTVSHQEIHDTCFVYVEGIFKRVAFKGVLSLVGTIIHTCGTSAVQ